MVVNLVKLQDLSLVPPLFDRLILMVIDGLPAEFVLGKDGQPPQKAFKEAMPYTQSLLSKGRAIGYHAKAAPPTVTMPRLKAMVSGAVGGFLDVAFNFNTQALLDDNIIVQFLKVGWKIVMHGDDTWLKLFPGMFSRHDGVSSFFVKDTVQVDQNVSRHLVDELGRTDWSLLEVSQFLEIRCYKAPTPAMSNTSSQSSRKNGKQISSIYGLSPSVIKGEKCKKL